jgi:Beta-lactamase
MVIGLVDERGSRVFTAGKLDRGTGQEEANGDTVFEIASITKTFTALLRDFKLATLAPPHRNTTEWRPCDVVRQFGSHGRAAIGELNVGRDDLTGRLSEEFVTK